MKKITVMVMTLVLGLSLVGCSSGNDGNNNEQVSQEAVKAESIKIEDLDWSVDTGIVNGSRAMVFGYTNNSNYTVVDFIVKFKLKDDVTDDQLAVFNPVKEAAGLSDSDVKNLYAQGYNHKISEPGETLTANTCLFNDTFRAVEDTAQFELMEPDTASIAYISDNKVYMTYYDFATMKYTEDRNSGREAFKWPSTDIAKLVPKPDLKVGNLAVSDKTSFYFIGYGVDDSFFNDYVNKCKEYGYTIESDINSLMYEAKGTDGSDLTLMYDKSNEQMSIRLEKSNVKGL